MTTQVLDLVGVGIGPSNLSLAALVARLPEVRARFLERRDAFTWHPGMMLSNTRMQTSFLKDLVTPVDPTSPFSFLSYLVSKGRFYRFLSADFTRVRRAEFADYMRWAAAQLESLQFGCAVESVRFEGGDFVVAAAGTSTGLRAKNLVLAVGLERHVPKWAEPYFGDCIVHNQDYMERTIDVTGKRVVVIGGGQSGAEIFLDVMQGARGAPADVAWISRRPNLEPLDETCFTNEYFTPDYVRQFHQLNEQRRSLIVRSQKLAGDGVSPETLRDLSQLLYEREFLSPRPWGHRILTHRDVRALRRERGVFHLHMRNGFAGSDESLPADIVILATGYRYTLPRFLDAIAARIERAADGSVQINQDYSVSWDGPSSRRIYMQNAGRNSHGIADPQLSLAAWRAAVIVNSVIGREVYPTTPCPPPVRWKGTGVPPQNHRTFEEAEL